jgi:signal transduction histidine kinase
MRNISQICLVAFLQYRWVFDIDGDRSSSQLYRSGWLTGFWKEAGATLGFSIAHAWYQSLWFLIFCAALGVLVVWALYRFRVRQVTRAISAQFDERLAERTRIARELNDTLLQTVEGSKLVADAALERPNNSEQLRSALEKLSGWLEQGTQEGQAALDSLRSSTKDTNDLTTQLRRATEDCANNKSMAVRFSVAGGITEMHSVARDETFRIGYEAIRNACEHSRATELKVELNYAQDLTLQVHDNGIGIDSGRLNSAKLGHFGLQRMRERALRIGSKLTIVSAPGSGTQITLVVPGTIIFQETSNTRRERLKAFLGLKNRRPDSNRQ